MIEFALIVIVLAAGAIYYLKKHQKKKCLVCSSMAVLSILFLAYMNYLTGL